jgi:zinc protease
MQVLFSSTTHPKRPSKLSSPAFGRAISSSNTELVTNSDTFQTSKIANKADTKPKTSPLLSYQKIETRHDAILGDIQVYRFSNGLTFYGVQKKDIPLVSFGDLYHTGSGIEKEWNDGAAHILEHMIFKGTKDIKPGEYDRHLENLGAYDNAWTASDSTFYHIHKIPKERLAEVIKLQGSVLARPLVDAKELEKEKGAILEEFNRFYNNKHYKAYDAIYGAIWPDHTYGRKHFGLGPKENIKALSREELLDFYGKHYGPDNHTVIAVGDFDLKSTLNNIAEHYNHSFPPTGEEFPKNLGKVDYSHRETPFKLHPSPKENTLYDEEMKMAMHMQGVEGPRPGSAKANRESVALDMLCDILGGGQSSRLHQQLVEKEQLASSVSMSFDHRKERSAILIDAQADPKNMDKVRRIIQEHLEKAQQTLVSKKELDKTITQNESALAGISESTPSILTSLAQTLGTNTFEQNYSKRLDMVRSITPDDLQQVARDYLSPDKMKHVNLLPKGIKFGQASSQRSLKNTPTQPSPFALRFGRAIPLAPPESLLDHSQILKDGSELIVRHKPGHLRTAISIHVKGGNEADPKGLLGLNDYLADLMIRGTKNLSATDIQHFTEDKGLSLGISSGENTTSFHISGLTKYKDDMVNLLSDVMNNPAFEKKELDFNKKQMRDNYQSSLDLVPRTTLDQILYETRFPSDHPYGITTNRLIQKAEKFTPENIRESYQQLFKRPNITISTSGGLSEEEALKASQKILDKLPTSSEVLQGKVVTAAREKMEQIELKRLWDAPSLSHPDRPAIQMLTSILNGSGMGGRLFKRFREAEHSLAYEVWSKYSPGKRSGSLAFYVGTDAKNTTKVQTVLQDELNKLMNEAPSQEEMDRAKEQYKTGYLAGMETNDAISSYLSSHHALGSDSIEESLGKINRVTPEQVQAIARKYLRQPSITAVVAPKAVLKEHGLPDPITVGLPPEKAKP